MAVFLSVKMPTDFKTIYWKSLQFSDVYAFFAIWVVVSLLFFVINKLLDKCKLYGKRKEISRSIVYIIIFVAWLPFYLSFYPGNISGDSYASIYQALNHINSTAHPVLFTLLVKACMKIGLFLSGDMNVAIAIFSIVQMLLLDGILTYTVVWLQRHSAPRWFCVGSTLYFALNPLIVRYSFTMWKDILFSGVMLLLTLFLYDIAVKRKSLGDNQSLFSFVLLAILLAFLRNRIIYAVAAIFVVLIIAYRKYWKKLLPVFFLTVVFIFIIQGPVYKYFEITPSNFAEGQGVSLQEIAAVVVSNGEMTAEEKAFVNQVIPLEDIPKAYFESTVDNLKGYKTFDHKFLNAHPKEYLNVWRNVIIRNPWISVKAWLMTTRGFWGFNVWIEPFAITWPSEDLGVYQTNFMKTWTGIDLEYFSNGILVNLGKIPVVRRMFELGSLGWFYVFCCARAIWKRKYRLLLPILPLILLWLVLIASTPIFFEARYMFVYHLALPVLVYTILIGVSDVGEEAHG